MFKIRYFLPYQQCWKTQTFNNLNQAQRMISFYQSCGSSAYLIR